jgi:DNA-directed RNA polymerase specialized sigma24 family protein
MATIEEVLEHYGGKQGLERALQRAVGRAEKQLLRTFDHADKADLVQLRADFESKLSVRLLERSEGIEDLDAIDAWLATTAVRIAVDHYREVERRKKNESLGFDADAAEQPRPDHHNVEHRFSQSPNRHRNIRFGLTSSEGFKGTSGPASSPSDQARSWAACPS